MLDPTCLFNLERFVFSASHKTLFLLIVYMYFRTTQVYQGEFYMQIFYHQTRKSMTRMLPMTTLIGYLWVAEISRPKVKASSGLLVLRDRTPMPSIYANGFGRYSRHCRSAIGFVVGKSVQSPACGVQNGVTDCDTPIHWTFSALATSPPRLRK